MGIFSEAFDKAGRKTEKMEGHPFYEASRIQHHLLGALLNVLDTYENRDLKLIGITSSHANEGVSTITRLIGHSFCYSSDVPTIVIDANLSSPSIHVQEGIPISPGFTDIILGEPDGMFHEVIKTKQVCPLNFITAGKPFDNLPFLYNHPNLDKFFSMLKSYCRYCFFDLPPVNTCHEVLLIAKKLDGIIFVVKAHETQTKVAKAAIDKLRLAETNIIGGILNRRKYFIPSFIYERL